MSVGMCSSASSTLTNTACLFFAGAVAVPQRLAPWIQIENQTSLQSIVKSTIPLYAVLGTIKFFVLREVSAPEKTDDVWSMVGKDIVKDSSAVAVGI